MLRKFFVIISVAAAFATTGCVKETYNMDTLSKKAHLSPTFAISAVRGDISLSDLIEPNDTVFFDENDLLKIVFREDSVIDFRMEDYYDLNDMVSFHQAYALGDLGIDAFQGTMNFSLDEISLKLLPDYPALRAQIVSMNGTTDYIPPFPALNIGTKTYDAFLNFEYATINEGSLDIFVKNNLPAPLPEVTVKLYNADDNSRIGEDGILAPIAAGSTGMTSIDLAGQTVRQSIRAEILLAASSGTTTPVPINLNDNIEITIAGRDIRVTSGRVVLPLQTIESLDNIDTVDFDPGEDVKIDIIKMNAGVLSYTIISNAPVTSQVELTLSTAMQGTNPITTIVTVGPNSTIPGTLSLDNSVIDLGTVASQPYNLLPVDYSIWLSSTGNMVTFNSTDEIEINIELLNPDFDYVKGYFGQKTETLKNDIVDLDIEEILEHISGEFLISSPSITLNYKNSFSLPVKIDLQATGYRMEDSVKLGLEPFILSYPAAPAERDISGTFLINKTNSQLPGLVSMPPEKIRFSGSAIMNPDNTNTMDNYIFGNSRFIGDIEIEVPAEFRMKNLTLTDTTENFLQMEETEDSPVNPEDFEFLRIKIEAENGFPLGISLSLVLYDSANKRDLFTIEASDILEPAPVDAAGRVTEPRNCTTDIYITQDFWKSVNTADKIIFKFTLNTSDDGSGAGSEDVKIYSDYKINFKAGLALKPDIKFDLK